MSWWWVLLILVGFYLLMGPIMLLSCKLNGVDPYVLEKEHPEEDERSFIMVTTLLRPMLSSLWLETKVIRWIKTKFSK